MSSTLRLFVNDNRISTAVPTKNGGIFQVYPVKKQFSDEVSWRAHWDLEMKPKIILKISHDEDERTFVGNWEANPKVKTAPAPAPTPAVTRSKSTIPASTSVPSWRLPSPVKPTKREKAKLSDWRFETYANTRVFTYSLSEGTYYIGDLCYVLGKDVYENVFGGTGYASGIYVEQPAMPARKFLVSGTAFGDGVYVASDGKEFSVDAGIIGICSRSLMAKNDGGGHVYTFDSPVTCKFGGGRFFFNWGDNSLVIDTTGDDDGY